MTERNYIVMGAGAWGTAVAIHLAKKGLSVILVPRDEKKAQEMQKYRENRLRLPGIPFPKNLQIDAHFEKYLQPTSIVFVACRMEGLVSICQQLRAYETRLNYVVSLIKGLDPKTLQTPSQVIRSVFSKAEVMCLTGPTLAKEFAMGKPAAMVLASKKDRRDLQKTFSSDVVRVYYSSDLLGAELGGCLKNVYAIGTGILDGMELGDNARAAYLTCVLKEMVNIGVFLGGRKETFYEISGLGDLLATTQGEWGRNRRFGFAFAQGKNPKELLQESTVEGFGSIQGFYERIKDSGIEAPILKGLYSVFYQQVPIQEAIQKFLSRPIKDEIESNR